MGERRALRRPEEGLGLDGGQSLVFFAFYAMAMLFMAALLFDGAHALLFRRELQNTADAAALAAANVLQSGTTRGCNGGGGQTPRGPVLNAALQAVSNNGSGLAITTIDVRCPSGYSDSAVQVTLGGRSPSFFAGMLDLAGGSDAPAGLDIGASAKAMNGGAPGARFSVVMLNPHNPTFSSSNNGCPSFLISGGPTITFDGNVHINSACPASSGGALGTNGSSATVNFASGSGLTMVGGYNQGPLVLNPPPQTGRAALRDPLRNLPPAPLASLPVRATSTTNVNNARVLEPGIYVGGINFNNNGRAFLRPGIYVIQNGNLSIGGGQIYSVAADISTSSTTTWEQDCPQATCGVLIYNMRTTGTLGQVSIGAQGVMMLRPYQPTLDLTGARVAEYKNLMIWQDANPVPSSSYAQPDVRLTGGGTVKLSGTLYTPSARVYMTGGSGGSGGDSTLTLQFISWDLQIQGNSRFHFMFNSDAFARPVMYGLID